MKPTLLASPHRHGDAVNANLNSPVALKIQQETRVPSRAHASSMRPPRAPTARVVPSTLALTKPTAVAAAPALAARKGAMSMDKAICAKLLAFVQKPTLERLLPREKTLVADIRSLVQQAVADRDDALRELQELRDRVDAVRAEMTTPEATFMAGVTPRREDLDTTGGATVP